MLVLFALVSAAFRSTAPQGNTTQSSPTTQIVLLGTGTPGWDPDRSGPATAIVVNGTPYRDIQPVIEDQGDPPWAPNIADGAR
jgi:hypothetical protein